MLYTTEKNFTDLTLPSYLQFAAGGEYKLDFRTLHSPDFDLLSEINLDSSDCWIWLQNWQLYK